MSVNGTYCNWRGNATGDADGGDEESCTGNRETHDDNELTLVGRKDVNFAALGKNSGEVEVSAGRALI